MTSPAADGEFLVETIVAVRPDGRRFDVTIRVAKPVEDNGPHACMVEVSPLDHQPARIYGEGAMQALFLALRFVKHRLAAAEEDRGVRIIQKADDDSDETFDCRHCWYGDEERPPTP